MRQIIHCDDAIYSPPRKIDLASFSKGGSSRCPYLCRCSRRCSDSGKYLAEAPPFVLGDPFFTASAGLFWGAATSGHRLWGLERMKID